LSNTENLLDAFRYGRGLEKQSLKLKIHRVFGVVWAQMKILLNYKMQFFLEVIDIILNVLIYYFIGFLVSGDELAKLGYRTSYQAFALVGIALSRYIWTSISRISRRMQREISIGTFESILVTNTSIDLWIIGQALFGFLWSSLWFVGTLVSGILIGIPIIITVYNLPQIIFIVLFSVLVHASIGILFAAIAILYKQIETVLFVFSTTIEFLGGVVYPIAILRKYQPLYYLSLMIPFTHSLELMRKVMISGINIWDPAASINLIALSLFLPLVWLSFKVLNYYYEEARKLGELSSY